jgi:hypothetical protein
MSDVTREELARALSRTQIVIEEPKPSASFHGGPDGWVPVYATGAPRYPAELAEELLDDIASQSRPSAPDGAHHGPGYYNGKDGMQPFDVIDAFGLDFYEGNVVKYIVRWRKKNGLEDLYKARTYIEQVIKRAEAAAEPVDAEIWCALVGGCIRGPAGSHLFDHSCQTRAEAARQVP